MYFRKKTSAGRAYLQIVESRREGAAVRQQVIATLGRIDELQASGQLERLLRSGARFAAKLIFNSAKYQAVVNACKIAPRERRGTTLRRRDVDYASPTWRTVGGRATPRAESARLAVGRGAERSRKRLPSCSTCVSVRESRSAITSGQEVRTLLSAAARRSSRSFFSTSARKLHATWPRIVSSSLW